MQKVKVFFIRFLVALLAFQGVVAAQLINVNRAQAADPARTVVINEVMWMGSSASSSDEWIELRNTTNVAIDISGWRLTNTATSGGTLTVPSSSTILASGYFLISNFGRDSESSILNIAPDWVTNTVALNNSCSRIDLVSGGENGTIVDSMGCDGEGDYFFPAASATRHSLERNIVVADGLIATSWHESVGFANLDPTAIGNLATPAFVNDSSAATGGLVNDGPNIDIDWSASLSLIDINWNGWTDIESGVTSYQVGLGTTPTTADIVDFASVGNVSTKTITFIGTESTRYFSLVRPVNGVGIVGEIKASDGFIINSLPPSAPSGVTVVDTPNDNGGSIDVSWTQSMSPDVVSHQVNYRVTGNTIWQSVNVGLVSNRTITGLLSSPVTYEFTVTAADFSGQVATSSPIVTGKALDNLVPVIDINKIIVFQNKPGSIDTVSGLAGASNEAPVTVTLLSAAPGDPTALVLGSVMSTVDGSFVALGIGDNKYAQVWLQLTDASNNLSLPSKLSNDIVGPTAPVLNKAVAKCESDICRVTLEWQAGSSDTFSYKVSYTVDGVENQTFEVTTSTMALDLASGKSYLFKVISFDQAGNPSVPSNMFSLALTKGVKTTTVFTNGQQSTTTEAISGSRQVSTASVPTSKTGPAQFAPKVKAAEPVVETPAAPTTPLVADVENSRDWVRILVVVVLLLIIAGSFYALSRSVQETPEEEFDRNKAESKDGAVAGTSRRRRHRRNRHK